MNELDKKYMYEMIIDYWTIIKNREIKGQNIHKGALHDEINAFYQKYVVNAPAENTKGMAQELVDGLVMLYEVEE